MDQPADSPILNGPYDQPTRYYEVGAQGRTGKILEGRRPSESFIPIPAARKGKRGDDGSTQQTIDFDLTHERRERNEFVNNLRREVERWRARDYERVTPTSRKLLQWWADPERGEDRVLFCQREAAETAIFLAEVAGRHGYADWRQQIADQNAEHNAGLPRVALKMATGSGKTVVMAMLIAWQTLNKVMSPRDARFTKRFLVVTPGITIRDRLRVLRPGQPGNYYDERMLLPPDLKGAIHHAQVAITNFHTFLLKDAKEVRGVSATTRKILRGDRKDDPLRETPQAMVSRVLRDFASGKEQLVVFNDEAHHCYQNRPVAGLSKADKEANEDARVWFRGLQAIHRQVGIKTAYDLSATPFYLAASGYNEGYIFPWVVSDFSLMDAIESGIVKIPRVPVDDDAAGKQVTYLHLWQNLSSPLPKRKRDNLQNFVFPAELEGALESLHRSYRRTFEHWETNLAAHGEPPPVYIVVCPNTVVSKIIYDYIAGGEVEGPDGRPLLRPGKLELLSNVVDGHLLDRPRTILVDSERLESGEALPSDFKAAAQDEIAAFKNEYRLRNPGVDVDQITDEDLLREVMNTVGKPGKLGEQVRCVVSVGMLTEGWDANTVTHILGVRAFGSQLLCEQVVGRGLRRRSYALNEDGLFEPEYANVYGVPFEFIGSGSAPAPDKPPRPPAVWVESVPGREHLRIEFPRVRAYRVEIPDGELEFHPTKEARYVVGATTVPTRTVVSGIAGESEREHDDRPERARRQQVAYELAREVLFRHMTALHDAPRPWLFPQLVQICRQWIDECVTIRPGFTIGHLVTTAEDRNRAAESIYRSISKDEGERRGRLRALLHPFDSVGSTGNVSFPTRKAAVPTEKSEVSHVTLDGIGGNTWEQILAAECELHRDVFAFVKNEGLGFEIPYVHQGRSHAYRPDFLVRLRRREDDDVDRTLIVEVSGGIKSPGPTKAKADTARGQWCVAVNNDGSFGRWGYIEITTMIGVRAELTRAIEALYADEPIIGDPDLLDLAAANAVAARLTKPAQPA